MARPDFGSSAKGMLQGLRGPLWAERGHAPAGSWEWHAPHSAPLPGLYTEIWLEARAAISSSLWAPLCLGTRGWCSKLSRSPGGNPCWSLPH